jgi:4-diphosphocytidyl-2-C-methyl-D-erythritol kinase
MLEVIEGGSEPFTISISGLNIEGKREDNILYKAWLLLNKRHTLPNIKVFLHKVLPMGAGLGGGSSDAAYFLKIMNRKFDLGYTASSLKELASKLGADCAFFIENTPVLAKGKGDEFSQVTLNLSGYHFLIVYPGIISNTKEAYEGVIPAICDKNLKEIIENENPENWKNLLFNDFEKSIFIKYPEIEMLKQKMYNSGAVYAAMSGSGSAVYGIFKEIPVMDLPSTYLRFQSTSQAKTQI